LRHFSTPIPSPAPICPLLLSEQRASQSETLGRPDSMASGGASENARHYFFNSTNLFCIHIAYLRPASCVTLRALGEPSAPRPVGLKDSASHGVASEPPIQLINHGHQSSLTLIPLIFPEALRYQLNQFQRAQRDAGATIVVASSVNARQAIKSQLAQLPC